MKFVHLHNHSHYSILSAVPSPAEYAAKAKEMGMSAIALTDNAVMYGAVEFYKYAKEKEIKPIIGCEVNIAPRKSTDMEHDKDKEVSHLTLLAETQEGYENLLELASRAHLEGMFDCARVDWELLEKNSKGLIALSGCLKGLIPKAILSGDNKEAKILINKFQKIYGKENFFLELQHRPELSKQIEVNNKLIELGKELNVPIVATNNTHYLTDKDKEAHDVMLCIRNNTNVREKDRFSMMNEDYSLKSEEVMIEAFKDTPEAIENTVKIADRCNVSFTFGINLIPEFPCPDEKAANIYLKELCVDGVIERYNFKTTREKLVSDDFSEIGEEGGKVMERLNYELGIIHTMGFDTYFLIVWDFIKHARKIGITVGPGRGSAAGAIVSYCLKITDIDPLQYQLLFERFLNPARVSMPDIDMDFADNRRDEVIDYVVKKYGRERVAQISTFGTLAARAAVKDVGRAMGVSFLEMNNFVKLIPDKPGTKLPEALETTPDLQMAYKSSPVYKKIIDISLILEGKVRHVSVHACAVIISQKPLVCYTALQHPPKDPDSVITQFSAKPLEALGLLKMDFLGLRNLTLIKQATDRIEKIKGDVIDVRNISVDDKKTYELFTAGQTTGVFQFESAGMKRYLQQLKPNNFEDIIAMVSLYRPGPMEWIPDYIKGKHGEKKVKYIHPSLESFLKNTYGIAIYQEQILQIAQHFAGFSLGEADLLRRAIGKKIASELMDQKEKFIEGALKNKHTKKEALEIFEKVIEPFAGYGFNKSHAACYSMIAYQTAYLKAHYPAEFMTALMTCDADNIDRLHIEIKECNAMGIKVLPPSINESMEAFTAVNETEIRFGLSAIKGVGTGPIAAILESREEGIFKTIEDLAKRVDTKVINKRTFESLAKSGTLDCFGDRNVLLANFEKISAFAKEEQKKGSANQTDLFGLLGAEEHKLDLDATEKLELEEKLSWEKEYLGMYLTAHPLGSIQKFIEKNSKWNASFTEFSEQELNEIITVCGIYGGKKKIITKKGDPMMILTIEGFDGQMSVTVFPKTFAEYRNVLENTEGFWESTGKLEFRRGQYQIIADTIRFTPMEEIRNRAKAQGLFDENAKLSPITPKSNEVKLEKEEKKVEIFEIKVPTSAKHEQLSQLKELLQKNLGDSEVILFIESEHNKLPLPIKINLTENLKKEIENIWK